jgi:hypothetical protein
MNTEMCDGYHKKSNFFDQAPGFDDNQNRGDHLLVSAHITTWNHDSRSFY